MSIFEDLENLNVSEECFDDIISLVEGLLSEESTYSKYWELTNKHGWSKGRNSEKMIEPDLYHKVWKGAEKKGLSAEKVSSLKKKAEEITKNKEEVSSPEENNRAKSGVSRLQHGDLDNRVHYQAMYGDKVLASPDYQHVKKIARKALKGRSLDGVVTQEEKHRNYPYQRHGHPEGDPSILYRIGKKVLKHRKNKVTEEFISQLLEDLKTLQKKHASNLYDIKQKIKYRKEDLKNGRGRDSYEDDHDDYYDYEDDDRDYMDVIARKSPGVSYTSAEWHDND